jgi:LysM repeat protein
MKNHFSPKIAFSRLFTFSLALALVAGALAALIPTQAALASSCKKNIKVQYGDSLGSIATKYDVDIGDLVRANSLYAPTYTIYVGQNLCIPADADPLGGIPKYANSLAADYTARIADKDLTIRTANFPQNSTFYVKVGPAGGPATEKIGQINTGSGGTLAPKFTLPDNLKKAAKVMVCLKNAMTDVNVCRTAKR